MQEIQVMLTALKGREERGMGKSKSMCGGCYNEEYHHGLGGAKGCWCYKDAKVIKRLPIHVDVPPPYNKKNAKPMLSCYRQTRMVYVKPEAIAADGYWRR